MREFFLILFLISVVRSQEISVICNQTSFDIVLVTDSSGSLRPEGFESLRNWVQDFRNLFENELVRLGLVQYALRAYMFQELTNSRQDFAETAENFEWLCEEPDTRYCMMNRPCVFDNTTFACQTATGDGMQLAREMLVNETRDDFTRKFMIVITDGFWNVGVSPYLLKDDIQQDNITIIAIGVGPYLNEPSIAALATPGPVNDTNRYVIVSETFSQLNETLEKTRELICSTVVIPIVIPPPDAVIISENIWLYSPFLLIPILAAIVAAFLLKKKPKKPLLVPEPEPIPEVPITVLPPMPETGLTLDTDIGASGAPPIEPNRPRYHPASRVTPGTFNRTVVTQDRVRAA